jgi:hypothetical protein
MGNAQANAPKLDFSQPLLGNTVTVSSTGSSKGTSSSGIIERYDTPEQQEVQDDEDQVPVDPCQVGIRVQITSGDTAGKFLETTLDTVSLAATPRSPYCCTQEEACAGWLWQRIPTLIDERVDADGFEGNKVDSKRIMKEMLVTESVMLGFLTVETKSKKADAEWDKLNLETLASKFVDSLVWRLNLNSHKILENDIGPELGLKIPGGLHAKGLNGRPVLWTLPCFFSWSEVTGDEIERVELRNQERMNLNLNQIGSDGKKYRDMIVIVNLDGMGAWVIKYLSKFKRHATVSETHYPGRAWKTLCINSGPVVARGYSTFVRPFLSTHTQNLVVMCAKGQETTDALRKYIAPEFVPRCFGGEAEGNGPEDIMLESILFRDGVNPTASKFRESILAKMNK